MKRAGFTMIELIFVIVILGILAAVAVPKLAQSKADAEAAALAGDHSTCTKAAELARFDDNTTSEAAIKALTGCGDVASYVPATGVITWTTGGGTVTIGSN